MKTKFINIQFTKPQEASLENIYLDIVEGAKNGHFNEGYADSLEAQRNLQILLTQAFRGGEILLPSPVDLEPVSSHAKLFSVEVEKCIVGYVLILKKKKSIEMLFAGIYQEYRGKGYGVALCTHFKKLYKKDNLVVRCKKNSSQMVNILLKLNFKIKKVDYPTINTYLVCE